MSDHDGLGLPEPHLVRIGVPVLAAGVGVLAISSDPGSVSDVGQVGVAVAMFAGWAVWPRLPTLVLAAGVLVPVVLAVRSGAVEPALFLVSLLMMVVAWFERSLVWVVAVGLPAMASPLLVRVLLPADEEFSYWVWVLGIAFPWLIGGLARRQLELVGKLESAREELAARVVTENQQRIARDVHDLVGHGLAAVLLQITSARHVLRRDLDAADEALAAAESAGRHSMAELRRTMALLREEDSAAGSTPPVGLDGVAELVRDARERGLQVRHEITGGDRVEGGVAIVVHRIVQEALANALRHAPEAATFVSVVASTKHIALEVTSVGRVHPRTEDGRPRYGLVGMREQADVAGGELSARPTAEGWLVRGRLPLNGSS